MNDLTEIKQLWQDQPPGSREDLAGARTALLAAAARSTAAPVSPPRRYGLRIGVATGLAAALTAGVIVAQVALAGSPASDGITGLVAAPPANAQQLLTAAAQVAAAEPDLRPGPGQYIHTELRVMRYRAVGSAGTHLSGTEERWIPAAGAKQWLMREHQATAAPVPGVPMPTQQVATQGTEDSLYESSCATEAVTELQMSRWPADVAFLREQVRTEAAKYTAIPERLREWDAVGTLLRSAVSRPGLSAALYRVAAEIPGITLVPETVDAAGRAGIGVAIEHDGTRSELIFDHRTFGYLGEREVAIEDRSSTMPVPPISRKEYGDLKRQMVAKGMDAAEVVRELEPLRKKRTVTLFTPRGAVISSSAVVKVEVVDALPPLSTKVSRMTIPC
ncbi:CU044_5270 family protein [Nonomuraea gerenzanensis]|uniref:CU044_5270 family protein n=1 Tax=Nonomuraea gerenzanensis TaxID=93944 RepID=A0A1M4E3Q5_9ACTN|nr:CU044_5270 family protein [Nonomuraea gerenzanensis]UBU15696.1 CU044_5270 family protein [Nonomuraea gerenzanensis]SBO93471.1 hypothetical protein BN4615_P2985 [Nonomuraea gerenzanensis]